MSRCPVKTMRGAMYSSRLTGPVESPRARPTPTAASAWARRNPCRRTSEGIASMATLKADLAVCQGYANCVAAAEDYFDIDDDGVVVLLKHGVAESDHARVQEAARSCPVSALRVDD